MCKVGEGKARFFEESELEDYVQGIRRSLGTRYLIYVVVAYDETKTIATGYNKMQRSKDLAKGQFSFGMNAPRTSVKWAFGLVQQHFQWVDDVVANNLAVTHVAMLY
jgi:hypothetical protein